nr:PsbP-related protein [uncultured Psychroserpens sp.]
MKKLFLALLCLLILNCSSSKTESSQSENFKYYQNDDFSLQYPREWKTHDDHGFLAFSPKSYLKQDKNMFDNILTIYKLDHENYNDKSIDDCIEDKKERATQSSGETHFQQRTMDTKNGTAIILELDKRRDYRAMKEISFYFTNNEIIYELRYRVRTDIYNDYINSALAIIDSFEFKN